MSENMSMYLVIPKGTTFRIEASIYNFPTFGELTGALADPDSNSIQLYTPAGVASGTALITPTKAATGQYTQNIDIPSDGAAGTWEVKWTAVFSSKNSIQSIKIKVK